MIKANIGDAHAMGQKPITFIRQVVSLVSYPELLQIAPENFPEDVKSRALAILAASRGSAGIWPPSVDRPWRLKHARRDEQNGRLFRPTSGKFFFFFLGCYSDSAGLELIRNHVAQYIERRDGFPANPTDIILCAGASEGIRVYYII